jgi:hypothetical protein
LRGQRFRTALPSSGSVRLPIYSYLPLAIALYGAMVLDGTAVEHVLDALRDAALSYLERQLANYAYPSVLRAIQVSLDVLESWHGAACERYLELAIFPSGASSREVSLDVELCSREELLAWSRSWRREPATVTQLSGRSIR